MDLKTLSLAQLEALKEQKNSQVDALRLEVKAIAAEIRERSVVDRVGQLMAGMTADEKQRVITKLAPQAIKSDEKFGKLGG